MKLSKYGIFIVLTLILSSGTALAYTPSPSDIARQDSMTGATRKLGRGVSNVGLGWVEFFKGIQSVGEEKGAWAAVTWGPLYGALNAVKRTAVGVGETVTFPVPGPNQYDPILEPEFVLEDNNN